MEIQTAELSNGLRIIHQEDKNSAVYHFGLFVNVGSRHETEEERGIAHFLEHVLFKGTKKRKAFHILNRLDVVGGELNAYTTKEETVVYASVLNNHMERAMEIIADITFNSVFPEKELEKEKEVVIDEIQSYQDSPSELIFEDFDNLLFEGQSLGNDILGTEADVRNITRDKIVAFVNKHYVPQNMVISSVGNFSLKQVVNKVKKHFDNYQGVLLDKPIETIPKNILFSKELQKETHQAHVIIGTSACSYTDDDKTALVLLNNYLGGPAMNSRLNMEIREKYGYAYNIDSSYHPYSDIGILSIYFGTDVKNIKKTKQLILKELRLLREKKLSVLKLHQAKEQLKGFIALGMESRSGLMLGLGKAFLMNDRVETVKESLDKIDSISADEIQGIANKYLKFEDMSELSYLSKT